MKICVAQIRPVKGNMATNIENHKRLIGLATSLNANAIFFPELSITSYEPELAKELATTQDDKRFDNFQQISNTGNITIGFGVPTASGSGVKISMVIIQPKQQRQAYSKQQLHSDELRYFVRGDKQIILRVSNERIAPAICYESLQTNHSDTAH